MQIYGESTNSCCHFCRWQFFRERKKEKKTIRARAKEQQRGPQPIPSSLCFSVSCDAADALPDKVQAIFVASFVCLATKIVSLLLLGKTRTNQARRPPQRFRARVRGMHLSCFFFSCFQTTTTTLLCSSPRVRHVPSFLISRCAFFFFSVSLPHSKRTRRQHCVPAARVPPVFFFFIAIAIVIGSTRSGDLLLLAAP